MQEDDIRCSTSRRAAGTLCQLLLTSVILAGCATDPEKLPTLTFAPGQSPGGVLLEGRLEAVGACVTLVTDVPEQRIALVWEDRHTAQYGPLRLFDERGALIASEGQRVWLGGEAVSWSSSECPAGPAFLVLDLMTSDPITGPL